MQTPVNNQTDQGRFIVDFLNASNSILGASYTSTGSLILAVQVPPGSIITIQELRQWEPGK